MSVRSEEIVDRRLREMGDLRRRWVVSPAGRDAMAALLRETARTAVTDMSPESVDRRIRRMAAMARLCLDLGRAGPRF